MPWGKRCLSSLRVVRKANAKAESGVGGQSLWSINFSRAVLMYRKAVCVRARTRRARGDLLAGLGR